MAKAFTEARQQHGGSELLDAIVSSKPGRDHTRYHSPDELKQAGLGHLRDALALLEQKATPQEVEDYRAFVLTLADRVANAHRERRRRGQRRRASARSTRSPTLWERRRRRRDPRADRPRNDEGPSRGPRPCRSLLG